MTFQFIKEISYVAFIANAIQDYFVHHHGKGPAKIKLHPEIYARFKEELSIKLGVEYHIHYLRFRGVTIQESVAAKYPEIIGWDGAVEYF